MRDLPNLDLLRACAVVSVVAEHALLAFGIQTVGYWQVRWMGIVGVLLFFLHTTLVLMWSLERRPETLDFYIPRARCRPHGRVLRLCAAAQPRCPACASAAGAQPVSRLRRDGCAVVAAI